MLPQVVSEHGNVCKVDDRWRMCVDFTNLNKACSRDNYPLPLVDALVDKSSSYELLMDAHLDYYWNLYEGYIGG